MNRENVKSTALLVLGVAALWLALDNGSANGRAVRAEKALTEASSCERTPGCLDQKAQDASYGIEYPVQSRTGRWFFMGTACTGDCGGHMAGYQWAKSLGVSKREACGGRSPSFNEGCLLYIEDGAS